MPLALCRMALTCGFASEHVTNPAGAAERRWLGVIESPRPDCRGVVRPGAPVRRYRLPGRAGIMRTSLAISGAEGAPGRQVIIWGGDATPQASPGNLIVTRVCTFRWPKAGLMVRRMKPSLVAAWIHPIRRSGRTHPSALPQ